MTAAATLSRDLPTGASPRRGGAWRITTVAVAVLAALIAVDVLSGPAGTQVGVRELGRVIGHHVLGMPAPATDRFQAADAIVWQLRMPRAVGATLIGALLAYAGVALQGLLMNPLAEPYTVGVSAGAAVGALGAELCGVSALWMGFGRVGVAFAAGVAAVLLVYALARVGGRVSATSFLLAGVIVGTMLSSCIPLLFTLTHRADDLPRMLFYLIGSLSGTDWPRALLLAPFLVAAAILLRLTARDLNLMTLGEETAAHLGVDIEGVKWRVLAVGTMATAAAVAVAGIIGFVGLVVPHIARRLTGPDHRRLLPLAAVLGASLLVAADTLVRVLLNDMQVGVITALVGAPVFCYLLRRRTAVAW